MGFFDATPETVSQQKARQWGETVGAYCAFALALYFGYLFYDAITASTLPTATLITGIVFFSVLAFVLVIAVYFTVYFLSKTIVALFIRKAA